MFYDLKFASSSPAAELTVLARWIPARRATKANPLVALRAE